MENRGRGGCGVLWCSGFDVVEAARLAEDAIVWSRRRLPSFPLLGFGLYDWCHPQQRTTMSTRREAMLRIGPQKERWFRSNHNVLIFFLSLHLTHTRLFLSPALLPLVPNRTTSPAPVTTPPSFPTPPVATRRSDSARPPAPSLSVLPAAS